MQGVPEVGEFFNSTEGNLCNSISLLLISNIQTGMLATVMYTRNSFGRGAVGHHGAILRSLMHKLYVPVKLNPETGDIWRDPATGFAKRQTYNVGGEILVQMPNPSAFPGYFRSEKETNKKLVRDVFRKGDLYYRSGDALRRTDDGLWYFLDRLGTLDLLKYLFH